MAVLAFSLKQNIEDMEDGKMLTEILIEDELYVAEDHEVCAIKTLLSPRRKKLPVAVADPLPKLNGFAYYDEALRVIRTSKVGARFPRQDDWTAKFNVSTSAMSVGNDLLKEEGWIVKSKDNKGYTIARTN